MSKLKALTLTDLGTTYASREALITPEFAENILTNNNKQNRNIRRIVVERFSHDMAAGDWDLTGQPIIFGNDKQLIDGQHRLAAAVSAGVSFPSQVITGAPPETRENIDTGTIRTLGDLLVWKGEVSTGDLAAALKLTWQYQQGYLARGSNMMPTNREALRFLELNPSLRDRVRTSHGIQKRTGIRKSALSAVSHHVYVATTADGGDGGELLGSFLDDITNGVDLAAGSGPLLLRSWVGRVNANKTHMRPTTRVYVAMLIKAWNLYVTGESGRQRLSWMPGKREAYPVILDLDGIPYEPHNELLD